MVVLENNRQVRDMIRGQDEQQAAIQEEIKLMSLATGEREIALAKLRAEQEMKALGKDASDTLAQAYIREAEATARLNQERAAARLQSDLNFEFDQMGRSETEQNVAGRLRGAGLPQDHAIAGQIRLNEQLKIGRDLAMDFGKGFTQDLMKGVEATEALTNALDRVASKLMDMAMDMAISSLFKGITGGLGIGGAGTSPMSGMGFATPTARAHTGGIIGTDVLSKRYVHPAYFDDAPRFHRGGMVAPDEVPIIARRGEGVFTPGQMAAMGQANITINPVIENHTDSKVSTEITRGQNGEVNIKTLIHQAAAEGASQPGNPLHRAVRTFGGGMPLTRR
jgi:hypothetical protein